MLWSLPLCCPPLRCSSCCLLLRILPIVWMVIQVPQASSQLRSGFVFLPCTRTSEPLKRNRCKQKGNHPWHHQQSTRIQSNNHHNRRVRTGMSNKNDPGQKKPLLFQSSIPKEVRKQIYEAEGNTQAAKDRTVRMIVYILLAIIGSLLGIGNGVMTELLSSESSADDTTTIVESSFAWLQDNPFLTTKWGGIVALLSAGVFGTLAELEWRTRDENAERIWEEMKRRQQQQVEVDEKKTRKMKRTTTTTTTSKGGSKTDTRPSKRMSELAQVLQSQNEEEGRKVDTNAIQQDIAVKQQQQDDGIFGKFKKFYKQADDMAAAQALLLNKKLEDTGVIEKITDESGLKVIGKDAASKLKEENKIE